MQAVNTKTNLTRTERDSFGAIDVPNERLWGAQTQRSLLHFKISIEKMPEELIMALAQVKSTCARVNSDLGLLSKAKADSIISATHEILAGEHAKEFPLSIWQTGSGTQTNMNMNEVLANRASEFLGAGRGDQRSVHPNDDVNLGQSSNDIFPTALHLAASIGIVYKLLPALNLFQGTLSAKSIQFESLLKIGRTHLQDATPLTLGQEFSGYTDQLAHAGKVIQGALPSLYSLAVGATAVGTGLNTHTEFGARVAKDLGEHIGLPLFSATNKFSAIAAHDGLVAAHGALKTLAVALMKIANDIRWLASGPRCGLGEINIPNNEPGSSIMPGKVNPTQCEALTMVCCQVMGNDVAISIGGASGNFELNVYKPLIAHNFLQSLRLLTDAVTSFNTYCASGIEANPKRISELLNQSLMLVTALVPQIGYDRAAAIAKYAHSKGIQLVDAALAVDGLGAEDFYRLVRAQDMSGPQPTNPTSRSNEPRPVLGAGGFES